MELIGTFSIVLIRGLVNISAERQDSSILASGLISGLSLSIFCFFTHGLSNGYFNPYFAMSDMIFKVIEIKEAIGKPLSIINLVPISIHIKQHRLIKYIIYYIWYQHILNNKVTYWHIFQELCWLLVS